MSKLGKHLLSSTLVMQEPFPLEAGSVPIDYFSNLLRLTKIGRNKVLANALELHLVSGLSQRDAADQKRLTQGNISRALATLKKLHAIACRLSTLTAPTELATGLVTAEYFDELIKLTRLTGNAPLKAALKQHLVDGVAQLSIETAEQCVISRAVSTLRKKHELVSRLSGHLHN